MQKVVIRLWDQLSLSPHWYMKPTLAGTPNYHQIHAQARGIAVGFRDDVNVDVICMVIEENSQVNMS